MFCKNCNVPLDADAAFCTNCGHPVEPAQNVVQQCAPVYQKMPMSPVKKKNVLLFGLLGVVLLAFILILSNRGGSHAGYVSMEEAAETLIMAQNTNDAEALVSCLPDFFVRCLGAEENLGANASRKAVVNHIQKSLDEFPPNECRIFYTEVIRYGSEEEFRTIRQRSGLFRYITDAELEGLEDIVYVKVHYECDDYDEESTVICMLINGLWYTCPC